MYCKNCGVELDSNMLTCPLCQQPVVDHIDGVKKEHPGNNMTFSINHEIMSEPQRRFTWEIISIILLSGAAATFIVNLVINGKITWSEYPAAICLAIFCYVSLFAFWNQKTVITLAGGFLLSSFALAILDLLTGSSNWSLRLAIPLLFAANLVIITLLVIVHKAKSKGVNLIAYTFLGAAMLCMAIEAVLRFFRGETLLLRWSIIVTVCVIPVAMVLLFVHFRLKRGRSLSKTFHI